MDKTEEWEMTLNISISAEDKKSLIIYALEYDTTVPALIYAYVEILRKEQK